MAAKGFVQLFETVEDTERRIGMLSEKLETYDRQVNEIDGDELPDDDGEVLFAEFNRLITEVEEDFEQIRADISDAVQLQREISAELSREVKQITSRYRMLKQKLRPALPEELKMAKNSFKPASRGNGKARRPKELTATSFVKKTEP